MKDRDESFYKEFAMLQKCLFMASIVCLTLAFQPLVRGDYYGTDPQSPYQTYEMACEATTTANHNKGTDYDAPCGPTCGDSTACTVQNQKGTGGLSYVCTGCDD